MSKAQVRISCFGLAERDVQLVSSLVQIINGRKKIVWIFDPKPDPDADVLIVLDTSEGAAKVCALRQKKHKLRTILLHSEGMFPPQRDAAEVIARYPLRTTDLLDIFDTIERHLTLDPAEEHKNTQSAETLARKVGSIHARRGSDAHSRAAIPAGVDTADSTFLPTNASAQSFTSSFEKTDFNKKPRHAEMWNSDGIPTLSDQTTASDSDLIEWIPADGKETPDVEAFSVQTLDSIPAMRESQSTFSWEMKPARHPSPPESASVPLATPSMLSIVPEEIEEKTPSPAVSPLSAFTTAASRAVLAQENVPVDAPTTIAKLVSDIQLIKQPDGSFRYLDVFAKGLGWIGRVNSDKTKVFASSRFMLESRPGQRFFSEYFYCNPRKRNPQPTLAEGDSLIVVERNLFLWQIAYRYSNSLPKLSMPYGKLRLARWPDLNLLPEFSSRPGILLATANLSKSAHSVSRLLAESRTTEADLSVLLAGCWLCGWLKIERPLPEDEITVAGDTGFSSQFMDSETQSEFAKAAKEREERENESRHAHHHLKEISQQDLQTHSHLGGVFKSLKKALKKK